MYFFLQVDVLSFDGDSLQGL